MSRVAAVAPDQVDALVREGAIALDIRDKEEHDADHIADSLHVSRGKLEMNVESVIPDLNMRILCYCNAYNRGALSADTLRAMGYANASFLSLVDMGAILRTFNYSKSDFASMLATIVCVLLIGVETGILVGVSLSLLLFLWRVIPPKKSTM